MSDYNLVKKEIGNSEIDQQISFVLLRREGAIL